MKNMTRLTLLALMLINVQAYAQSPIIVVPKVIYGTDDRMDIFESHDNLMKELSLSTAAQIYNSDISETDGIFSINEETLAQNGICKSERFSDQQATANCTGFLIAPDVLVTAGHCVFSEDDCNKHKWVFDYANKVEVTKGFTFSADQVFTCTKLIERQKEASTGLDYAIVKLDRKVSGRSPLKFRKEGKVSDDAVLTVIGHPSGVPTKISPVGDMRDNTQELFFVMSSDTFSGNSGSPVIDSISGLVEGILVRGDTDYTRSEEGCSIPVINDQNGGRGEDAVRTTSIKSLQKY